MLCNNRSGGSDPGRTSHTSRRRTGTGTRSPRLCPRTELLALSDHVISAIPPHQDSSPSHVSPRKAASGSASLYWTKVVFIIKSRLSFSTHSTVCSVALSLTVSLPLLCFLQRLFPCLFFCSLRLVSTDCFVSSFFFVRKMGHRVAHRLSSRRQSALNSVIFHKRLHKFCCVKNVCSPAVFSVQSFLNR